MKYLLSVLLPCLAVSCADRQIPPPQVVRQEVKSEEWKAQQKSFESYLLKVPRGWSHSQLFNYAGAPDSMTPSSWSYRWEENRVEGGDVLVISFHFEQGLLSEIDKKDYHVSRTAWGE